MIVSMQKKRTLTQSLTFTAACLLVVFSVGAQNLEMLRKETASLYQQGQYARAAERAKQAVRLAEDTLGPDHLSVASSLNDLALMLVSQGQYAQVEPFYLRALKIYERTSGPDMTSAATVRANLGDLYKLQYRNEQAEQLYQQALDVYERAYGPDHPNTAQLLIKITGVAFERGRLIQAEALAQRALAIQEKALGPENPALAVSLSNLAFLYMNQARYSQAEPLLKRALAICEKAFGPNHPDLGYILNNLGELYTAQGEYARAEAVQKRSLALREKALGQEHPNVAVSLVNLAGPYLAQDQYLQAEKLFRRALAIIEKSLGPTHPHVASVLNQLALAHYAQGQHNVVEALLKRALEIREQALGANNPDLATSLNNLAALYTTEKKYVLADELRERARRILNDALGPDHPRVAEVLSDQAYQWVDQGRYAEAEVLYRQALLIREKTLTKKNFELGTNLYNLAEAIGKQGRYEEALPLFRQAHEVLEDSLGPDHALVATSLHKEADLYQAQGDYAKAEALYQRSRLVVEKIVGEDHPGLALSLNNQAKMYRKQGRNVEALLLARRASAIARQRIANGGTDDAALREAVTNRTGFQNHLALLSLNPNQEEVDVIVDESLQIVQLEQMSGTASAIAKMAARFATGDDTLAGLIKRKQDAAERRARHEAKLLKVASRPSAQRVVADEQRIRGEIVSISQEIETINAELALSFPQYQELTRQAPLDLGRIRSLLKHGEALLVYALGEKNHLWVVRQDKAMFLPLSADVNDVSAKVAAARANMMIDANGALMRLDAGVLHALYQALMKPAQPHLDGVKHLLVVPVGALQSLSFSMLIATPPPAIKTSADYRKIDWLVKRYAISVLPSVGSLQAFRQFSKTEAAREPFVGFGDPLIGETEGGVRGKRGSLTMASVFRNPATQTDATTGAVQAEIADVDVIRRAPRLPETADELRAIGTVLKAGADTIWLQHQASEATVKRLDLSRFRTVVFATHGVMAGEIQGIGEPGLILTPPAKGSAMDDGYLAASEVAQLRLNADWVVLSACNTAATDGSPGAEGFSGLAKAFFYSGARSLLVSHWPVASEATVPLTTGMLKEYNVHPEQGKAEAHRKAMLALINTPNRPEYAHPMFWAPFVVVGEGGTEIE
ncbi:CHAT domain-containing tetratricopeptide repeat protein [Propionivibrio dicarboxylicus]|uniref:Tetratricopeptide repeat-containing protein n=1 Tax=Propionivibrio dicarboxylicus TaxID=83767 RepID=A0A1G8J0I5_9RHOO|nr:tetratricopeptide repeat protein [Propionivibrio dicarboxylicus]SDI24795.1 Tetratricopeptide repeat-containing protein [Propionivibrio dicarboxylicus]